MFIFTGTLLYDSDRSVLATVSDPVQSLATSINDQGPAGMKLKLKLNNVCTGSTSHGLLPPTTQVVFVTTFSSNNFFVMWIIAHYKLHSYMLVLCVQLLLEPVF